MVYRYVRQRHNSQKMIPLNTTRVINTTTTDLRETTERYKLRTKQKNSYMDPKLRPYLPDHQEIVQEILSDFKKQSLLERLIN